MRFDLTVPLARFAAQHIDELGMPFKRYHIATVWRGENTQRGRYREFMQCDFDTIGTDSPRPTSRRLLVIHDLVERIGFARFTVRVNHRQLLNGLLETIGLADKSARVLRALDKLGKVGRDAVSAEMQEAAGATAEQAARVLDFAAIQGEPSRKSAAWRSTRTLWKPSIAAQPLPAVEEERFKMHPGIAYEFLRNIPRLETVALMIAGQQGASAAEPPSCRPSAQSPRGSARKSSTSQWTSTNCAFPAFPAPERSPN